MKTYFVIGKGQSPEGATRQLLAELAQWAEGQMGKSQSLQLTAPTQKDGARRAGETQAWAQAAEFLREMQVEEQR